MARAFDGSKGVAAIGKCGGNAADGAFLEFFEVTGGEVAEGAPEAGIFFGGEGQGRAECRGFAVGSLDDHFAARESYGQDKAFFVEGSQVELGREDGFRRSTATGLRTPRMTASRA